MLRGAAEVVRDSYFHLVTLFIIAVFLLKLGILPSWQINFLLFAVILGVFGFSLKDCKQTAHLPLWLVWAAVGLALLVRTLPYIGNSVPLGYDPGIHKFSFEQPFGEAWIDSAFPLPFLLVMAALTKLLGSWFVLVPLFILLSAITAYALYYIVQRRFDRDAGIIAAMLFAVSITQFETFWYNYYKNVLGIIALLVALMYTPNNKHINWKLIVAGIAVGSIHQPALFIFGVTYIIYVLLDIRLANKKVFWNEILNGVLIVAGIALVNYDRIFTLYLPQLLSSAAALIALEGGSGTFFDAKTYFYYAIMVVPFAITGFIHYWRKNEPFTIAAIVTTAVVVLKLFFHNRFITYLAVFVIVYGALGFLTLIQNNNRYGKTVLAGFLALALVLVLLHAHSRGPLISEQELRDIETLNSIEEHASVVSTDKYYSPWLLGYVDRPVVAPGLFDSNNMNKEEWAAFWEGENRSDYLDRYEGPLYLYVGRRQPQYNFSDICETQKLNTAVIYRCP